MVVYKYFIFLSRLFDKNTWRNYNEIWRRNQLKFVVEEEMDEEKEFESNMQSICAY